MTPLRLKKPPNVGTAPAFEANRTSEPVDLDFHGRDTAWEWEGGEIVLLAYAVAVDRHGDCWWHDVNWANWVSAWEKNRQDAESLHLDYGWTPLPEPRELSPEEKAVRDRATEEELLALERELYGPFWYVERNIDPAKQSVGSEWLSAKAKAEARKARNGKPGSTASGKAAKGKPRKSRRKPVFWTR
jgi:hypothetical protein